MISTRSFTGRELTNVIGKYEEDEIAVTEEKADVDTTKNNKKKKAK